MERISKVIGTAVCLLRDNIDTDAIIPSREIKSVSRSGLGPALFAGWRYLDTELKELNHDFVLNRLKYRGARILFAGTNFGCGSSREHAVWALRDSGFDAVVAPSFGRIFYDNCICNGLLPVKLEAQTIQRIAEQIEQVTEAPVIRIDLARQIVTGCDGSDYGFDISAANREQLLSGLDQIDMTLKHLAEIVEFRKKDKAKRSWAYLK